METVQREVHDTYRHVQTGADKKMHTHTHTHAYTHTHTHTHARIHIHTHIHTHTHFLKCYIGGEGEVMN